MTDRQLDVRHVTVSIGRPPADVARFAGNGDNLTRWASGLSDQKITRAGDDWVAEGKLGRVKVRFAAENGLGVLDHDVTLPNGVTVHNPFRVIPNAKGSTLIFSVLKQPGTTDEAFEDDVKTVRRDLETLKTLLEKEN